MRSTLEQPAPRRGTGRKTKQQFFNRPRHLNKSQKKFQGESYWSRLPEQRRRDAAILEMVWLRFVPAAGTFYRLGFGRGGSP